MRTLPPVLSREKTIIPSSFATPRNSFRPLFIFMPRTLFEGKQIFSDTAFRLYFSEAEERKKAAKPEVFGAVFTQKAQTWRPVFAAAFHRTHLTTEGLCSFLTLFIKNNAIISIVQPRKTRRWESRISTNNAAQWSFCKESNKYRYF